MHETYLGIDFSGNHRMWRRRVSRSNVWIAQVIESRKAPELRGLCRVQELPGEEPPFERLTRFLREGRFRAAAIDAPFSAPREFVRRGHGALLQEIADLARSTPGRPFPKGWDLVHALAGRVPCDPKKPLRQTEREWQEKGVNVRSTLWCGTRSGAAMTAACLTLLHGAVRPIWPWAESGVRGLLAEAFPAAQLRHWGLPHVRYDGDIHRGRRADLVSEIGRRLAVATNDRASMLESADALDAVVCAFAARAAYRGEAVPFYATDYRDEGWIAIHQ